jgi:hypothetical protein
VGTTNSKPLGPIINDRPIRNTEPQSGPIFYLLLIFGTKQFAKKCLAKEKENNY